MTLLFVFGIVMNDCFEMYAYPLRGLPVWFHINSFVAHDRPAHTVTVTGQFEA